MLMVPIDRRDEDIQQVIPLEMSLEDNSNPNQLEHLLNRYDYHVLSFDFRINDHEMVIQLSYLRKLPNKIIKIHFHTKQ